MDNQSELKAQLSTMFDELGSQHKPGSTKGRMYSSRFNHAELISAVAAYIAANYTLINQQSTNTTPVTDDVGEKQSTKEEIEFRLRMADVPEKYIEIAANSMEHLVAERERLVRLDELANIDIGCEDSTENALTLNLILNQAHSNIDGRSLKKRIAELLKM